MTFRRRNYPEILNNLLTGIMGGVTAEAHPFPPPEAGEPPYGHALEKTPVKEIIAVFGFRNGQSFEFAKGSDYILAEDQQTLQWEQGGQLPDAGSVLQINYMPADAQGAITDLHVGSVARTLAESAGLEMARIYAQMEGVYKSGFIDMATGKALDHVVALLGLQRINAGRCSTEVEFTRTPGSQGTIHIPAQTRIMTEDGSLEYETTTSVTLVDGQNTSKVVARDVEENTVGAEADALSVIAKPIAGIAVVTNPVPAALTNADESDDALRTRAKNFLHGSERATIGAIKEAVTRQGVKAEVVELENEEGFKVGKVEVIPHTENIDSDLLQRIQTAIYDARPAGVNVTLATHEPPTKIDLTIRVQTSGDLLEADLRTAHEAAHEKIADYFDNLPASEPGSVNRVIGLVLGVAEFQDMEIISSNVPMVNGQFEVENKTTVLGDLEIVDPNLPTLLQVVITYPDTHAIPDPTEISDALHTVLDQINSMNDTDALVDETQRSLTFVKLLYVLPLPIAELAHGEFNQLSADAPPALPAENDADPYAVRLVFTKQNNVSQIVEVGSTAYVLTAFERLTLAGVETQVEAP